VTFSTSVVGRAFSASYTINTIFQRLLSGHYLTGVLSHARYFRCHWFNG